MTNSEPTFTHIFLEKASRESSKNHTLYLQALEAGSFISANTNIGDTILLAKKSGPELYATFIGAILVGRRPLVIQRPSPKVHAELFEKRMMDIKNQVNVTLCFCDAEDSDKFSQYFQCKNLSPKTSERCKIIFPKKEDIAFIQMSSGTTGVSKICAVSHQKLIDHCLAYGKVINMDDTKCVASWLPLYHDMGLIAAFLLPIIHDAEIHIIDPFDWLMSPQTLLNMACEFKATHCWMPSFAFNYLVNKIPIESVSKLRLDSFERVISCSEPTFCDDLTKFIKKFSIIGLNPSAVSVCYALAENVFAVSQSDGVEETEWKGNKYASCGKVIDGVSVKIIKDGLDVTASDDGTVMIKSAYEPSTNIKANPDDYYNTGDRGFFKNGQLYIIGREKDMFASYGVNIYPETIEHAVANIDGIIPGRVVCFGVFFKDLGTNKVVICVESSAPSNQLKMAVSTIIKDDFQIASIVDIVNPGELIKTSSGKFCRIKNKEVYEKKIGR